MFQYTMVISQCPRKIPCPAHRGPGRPRPAGPKAQVQPRQPRAQLQRRQAAAAAAAAAAVGAGHAAAAAAPGGAAGAGVVHAEAGAGGDAERAQPGARRACRQGSQALAIRLQRPLRYSNGTRASDAPCVGELRRVAWQIGCPADSSA